MGKSLSVHASAVLRDFYMFFLGEDLYVSMYGA